MTNERAIKQLINQVAPNGKNASIEAIGLAISSLEYRTPRKPDYEGDGYDENGELIYDTWICPCCECKYEVDYDNYAFCPHCGQALDWSD